MKTLIESVSQRAAGAAFIVFALCLFMSGCVKQQYQPEPINTDRIVDEINSWTLTNPDLIEFLKINGVSAEALNNRVFSIRDLYLIGLFYNPEMQLAYKTWEKAKIVANYSDYRINPEFSIPFEYHSDTSNGQSPWTIGAVLSFIYERKGKREARQTSAQVQLLNAALKMEKLAIDNYVQFQKQYQLYAVSMSKLIELKNEIDVLKELQEQLQKKYELGAVSQFELSTINLKLQQRLFDLSLLENRLDEHKDNLLALTNLSHTEYANIKIKYIRPLGFYRKHYQSSVFFNEDISTLQRRMLDNHPEMALKLNNYAQSEAELRLEIEKQYPDIVLSPGFIFDQSDNIWTLGASWLLPLFENSRQNLRIIKALEDRKIKQQQVVALQKRLLNDLYKRHRSVLRRAKSLKVSDEIINAIEKRAEIIRKQIELGGADRIMFLRNRMEFYKAEQTRLEIYHDAINAMLDMEQLLQQSYLDIDISQIVASWINKQQ